MSEEFVTLAVVFTRDYRVECFKIALGFFLGNHINNVEGRNKHTKVFLKRRGGGSRNPDVLKRNLGEILYRQWFAPRGPQHAYYDIFMFTFGIWACYGFQHARASREFELPPWLLAVCQLHMIITHC